MKKIDKGMDQDAQIMRKTAGRVLMNRLMI